MEQNLARLRLWDLLRVISTALAGTTSLVSLFAIPIGWSITIVPLSLLTLVAATLTVTKWKMVWIWLALLVQVFLFTLGLFATIFGLTSEGSVPVLLLMFTMILASEHTLTTTLSYSTQFSNRGNLAVQEFNAEALKLSVSHLCRRLARDGLILGIGFVLSVVATSIGTFGPAASILSDPSLYMIIASISLAALVMLKEE